MYRDQTMVEKYLYLTTIGRISGKPREVEIWFCELKGKCYIVSHLFDCAQWVQNIQKNPKVSFRVGESTYEGQGRILDPSEEPELCAEVKRSSEEKYTWSDGLIVELRPSE